MMSFDLLRTLRCAAGAIAMLSCLTGCGGGGTSTLAATDPTTVPVPAIGAGRVDHVSIDSTALHKSMDVEVYLPQGYSAARRYPVLYMFYGYGGKAAF
jgi:hypothetical protein